MVHLSFNPIMIDLVKYASIVNTRSYMYLTSNRQWISIWIQRKISYDRKMVAFGKKEHGH